MRGSREWGASIQRLLPLSCIEGSQQDLHQHTGGVRALHAASWRIPAGAHHLSTPPRGWLPGQDVLGEEGRRSVSVRESVSEHSRVSLSLMWGSLHREMGSTVDADLPEVSRSSEMWEHLSSAGTDDLCFPLSLLRPASLRRKVMRRRAWEGCLSSWLVR